MAQIVLDVSDEKLAEFAKAVMEQDDTVKQVLNPLELLKTLLQYEIESVEVYVDEKFNAGGNSIGDVFKDGDFEDKVVIDFD